jgi:hypothetical protein
MARRLTYWICDCLDDHSCYSLRAKTRREVGKMREKAGATAFGKPRKVVIEYADAFDLMLRLKSEDGEEGIPRMRWDNA